MKAHYSGMETLKLGKVYHYVHGVCMSVVRSNSCLLCNPIIRILQTLAPAEIRRQSHAGSGGKQQRMLLSCCSIFCPTPAWFISIYPQLNWNYKWSLNLLNTTIQKFDFDFAFILKLYYISAKYNTVHCTVIVIMIVKLRSGSRTRSGAGQVKVRKVQFRPELYPIFGLFT